MFSAGRAEPRRRRSTLRSDPRDELEDADGARFECDRAGVRLDRVEAQTESVCGFLLGLIEQGAREDVPLTPRQADARDTLPLAAR